MLSIVIATIVVTVASALLVTIVMSFVRTGVPTVASARAAQENAALILRERGAKRVYELGSGKGDFVMRLAALLPGATVHGFEISLLPYLYAQLWRLMHPARKRVRFHLVDFRKISLSDADGVVCYLMPRINVNIAPKLEKELRPGTTLLSVSFSFPMWEPEDIVIANNWAKTRLFVYRAPFKKSTLRAHGS